MIHPDYPAPEEVDAWCLRLLTTADETPVAARALDAPQYTYQLGVRHTRGNQYVAFEAEGRPTFYGYWQPAPTQPAPILFHVPSYAAEIAAHPGLVAEGFNVLHVNPLGYYTPLGPGRKDQNWTVLPDTVKSKGEHGYVDWLTDAVLAVQWALSRGDVCPERFAFFGTSQGAGGALLLGSLFAGRGVRAVAADLAFLTNFPAYVARYHWEWIPAMFGPEGDRAAQWKALGYVDTVSHAHRLTFPVLLTAGSEDGATPPDSIESLFRALPGTKSYTLLKGQGHAATVPFIQLAHAWFRLHV